MTPTPLHLLAVLGPLIGGFVVFVCWMVRREERRHPKEIVVRITVNIAAITEAMQRLSRQMAAVGTSTQSAAEALARSPWVSPELWALAVGDEHNVPQIGDEELLAWREFISETKQRSSRIVTR